MKKFAFIISIVAVCAAVLSFLLNWWVNQREEKEKRVDQTAAARAAKLAKSNDVQPTNDEENGNQEEQ